MDARLRQQAIALYDRFTHEGMDRRLFMSRMVVCTEKKPRVPPS
jgi:hypothetical protein